MFFQPKTLPPNPHTEILFLSFENTLHFLIGHYFCGENGFYKCFSGNKIRNHAKKRQKRQIIINPAIVKIDKL